MMAALTGSIKQEPRRVFPLLVAAILHGRHQRGADTKTVSSPGGFSESEIDKSFIFNDLCLSASCPGGHTYTPSPSRATHKHRAEADR